MKLKTRIMSGIMAALMLLTVACEEDGDVVSGADAGEGFDYDSQTDVGNVIWLGYYDLNSDGAEGSASLTQLFEERHGGTIEYIQVGSVEYYDKLALMIQNDQSPDLVRSEWASYPDGMDKNQFEPLDEYIDLDSPLWSGMKEYIEMFMWKDTLYFPAYRVAPELSTVIHYDYDLLTSALGEENDPYTLYQNGEWTLSKMKEFMSSWVALDKENNIGYSGFNAIPFIATTGKALLSVNPDGTVVNNLKDSSISDIMLYLQDNFNNRSMPLTNGEWIGPDGGKPFEKKNRLFYGMGLDWTYTNSVLSLPDTEFRFVPYPRYENADKYYTNMQLFGYLVPKGAKNINGALTWIFLNRQNEIEPDAIAQAKENAINPPVEYYTAGKKKGQEKPRVVWTEAMWDLRTELGNPEKFGFVFEGAYGVGSKLKNIYEYYVLKESLYGEGETTWTKIVNEQFTVIEEELKTASFTSVS